jgi:hypothetical protein
MATARPQKQSGRRAGWRPFLCAAFFVGQTIACDPINVTHADSLCEVGSERIFQCLDGHNPASEQMLAALVSGRFDADGVAC